MQEQDWIAEDGWIPQATVIFDSLPAILQSREHDGRTCRLRIVGRSLESIF